MIKLDSRQKSTIEIEIWKYPEVSERDSYVRFALMQVSQDTVLNLFILRRWE